MSWGEDDPPSSLLPPLLCAQLATAGPVELLEGHRNNLGIPAVCSPSSKPAFVPKRAGELWQVA